MRTSLPLFLGALLATVTGTTGNNKLPEWGAEYCPVKPKLEFGNMRKLLKEEDTSAFTTAVSQDQGSDVPSLEDLTAMANTLNKGEVPEYIKNNDYAVFYNQTGTHNYDYGNIGSVHGIAYVRDPYAYESQKNADTEGTLDVLLFNFIQGKVGEYNFTAGQAFFRKTEYLQETDTLRWLETVKGAFIGAFTGPEYVQYGSYSGVVEGTADLTCGALMLKTDSLGIMNTTDYFSKTVANTTSILGPDKGITNLEMNSITGGSNCTMTLTDSQAFPPGENKGNGTVRNSKLESNFQIESRGYQNFNQLRPFSKENFPGYFATGTLDVGIYLPG